ncbi:DUF222 domain-containing protein [Gordonia sp. HNM0687]|uniref:DUF222 domain-containing protein n=1 Tax=Gordonia mangrovi TaxID=2665643 RepID=A0A6L7GY95_9ACTN|nr:HNH endonuclease signature motif containing protein [Gordonia mangrovi]MXP23668.1 DUF222 domain-containing protein [Gordonia mangrovi]UVF79730.1 HNH endonuclease [Gordonia mangrovi]
MRASGDLTTITDSLRELCFADDMSGRAAFDAMTALVTMRNLIEHHAATVVGHLDRLGVARDHGRRLSELLIVMGLAPAVASRLIRIAGARAKLPTLAAHAADGAVSAEHVDAVGKGVEHVEKRSAEPIDDPARLNIVTDLLAHFFSGATPAEIGKHARRLGNQQAEDTGGLPACEDRNLNALTHDVDGDGRLQVRADLNTDVGEKFSAAMEELAAPRPEPDGSPDARSPERRHADALEALLDIAARSGDAASAPRTQMLVSVPADTPDLAELPFMGSLTEATLRTLTCDTTATVAIVDGEQVPMEMSKEKRLFPPHLRKALHKRDQCCIKCGVAATRCQGHHLVHWADGGITVLDNGCLLCPSCHADIHHNGWEVIMGHDRHPWLIPPTTVDPKRQPIPAYNRRTMNLDNLPAAA